jgi:hypothetical protein
MQRVAQPVQRRTSAVGASRGPVGVLRGEDSLAGTIARLAAPLERRAMRRDRSRSAICFGTSADLIKLMLAPWCAVVLVNVGPSGAKRHPGEKGAQHLVYTPRGRIPDQVARCGGRRPPTPCLVLTSPKSWSGADHRERCRPRSWSYHPRRPCIAKSKPRCRSVSAPCGNHKVQYE